MMRVLITGGAGFIGTHLSRRLVAGGHSVRVLDNLSAQVHGENPRWPAALPGQVECVLGDVRDSVILRNAMAGQQVIIHLAAETGTGQSMYAVRRYEEVNVGGTAALLDLLVNDSPRTVERLVVASSRAVYGEGRYRCEVHGAVYPGARSASDLAQGDFDVHCPLCGAVCVLEPTDESAQLSPASFYGLTKQMQEQMVLMFGRVLGIPSLALRFQNVYGPGQSLINPYTGILSVFFNAASAGEELNVFEDGRAARDFVYIDDVVEAVVRSIEVPVDSPVVLNVGSGVETSILEMAHLMTRLLQSDSPVRVSGNYRIGDIRSNVADLALAQAVLGFRPGWALEDGLARYLEWAGAQPRLDNRYGASVAEMRARGLLR